jgi:hypothetical protein
MPFIKVAGFAPDADPTEPGVLTDCDALVPTLNGVQALPGDVDQGVATAASAVRAVATLGLLDGTFRTFAGTADNLYEISSLAWTNVSKLDSTASATLSYSTTADVRWTFCQYGNVSFAAQKGVAIQFSDSSGRFADVTTAPQAALVTTALDFIIAANTNDATYGDQPDRWRCSAAGDYTTWTADIATQAATGRLTDEPGPIRALKTLGNRVVAYKDRGIFIGTYVGPPTIWTFELVPGSGLGASSPYGVVDLESAHAFLGEDNFYLYDGVRPAAIGTNRVADFILTDMGWSGKGLVVGMHDRQAWRVYWWYPSANSLGTLDRFVVYNYRSGQWGRGTKTVSFAWEYLSDGVTYDGLGNLYTTYDDIPTEAYDSLFTTSGQPLPATIDSSAKLYTLTGSGADCNLTTGDIGVDSSPSAITRIRPRFRTAPTTGTQAHYYRDQIGGTERTSTTATTLVDGAFDHVWAARWHRWKHSYTGNMELLGWHVDLEPESLE